jgi:hypothetical protein
LKATFALFCMRHNEKRRKRWVGRGRAVVRPSQAEVIASGAPLRKKSMKLQNGRYTVTMRDVQDARGALLWRDGVCCARQNLWAPKVFEVTYCRYYFLRACVLMTVALHL